MSILLALAAPCLCAALWYAYRAWAGRRAVTPEDVGAWRDYEPGYAEPIA